MKLRNKKRKLVLLSLFSLLLYSYPLLSLTDKPKMIANIPVLYLYLFITWILIIIVTYILTEKKSRQPHG